MANITLENFGEIEGLSGASSVSFPSTTATVTVITGLTATKTASPVFWAGGELTYTVVIENESGNDPFTGGVFTDSLNALLDIAGSQDPVQVNGAGVPYDFTDNVLTVENLPTVPGGGQITITFRVVLA